MKGGDHRLGDGKAAHQLVHPLHHLLRGFVGERHGQDGVCHDAAVFDEMGDAVGDNPGLTAARPGEDEDRPVRGFNGFALLRVEFIEERQVRDGSEVR